MGTRDTGRSIKSVETTTALIDHLREMEGTTITELAEVSGLSTGAVHTHLATLKKIGYVVQNGHEYDLGPELLTLGEYIRNHSELYRASKDQIETLAEETGQCVHLIIEHHGKLYALYERFGPEAVGVEFHDRKREESFHLHSTAAGKSILAHLDERRREEIITTVGLPKETEYTITDREELLDELETIRENGYAVVDEEQIHGIRAVSAPIIGPDRIEGSIAISGPTSRLQGETFTDELPAKVIHATNVCEVNLQTVAMD